jgi:hypothetical protein
VKADQIVEEYRCPSLSKIVIAGLHAIPLKGAEIGAPPALTGERRDSVHPTSRWENRELQRLQADITMLLALGPSTKAGLRARSVPS